MDKDESHENSEHDPPIEIEDIINVECKNGTVLRYRAVREIDPDRTVFRDGKRKTVTLDEYKRNRRKLEVLSPDRGPEYHIITPSGDQIKLQPSQTLYNGKPSFSPYPSRQAKTLDGLWERTDGFAVTDDVDLIPVDVAVEGKPVIATYLKIVHQLESSVVADRLGISSNTVGQYMAGVSGESR